MATTHPFRKPLATLDIPQDILNIIIHYCTNDITVIFAWYYVSKTYNLQASRILKRKFASIQYMKHQICAHIARRGHINLLIWALDSDCYLYSDATYYAAKNKQFDCLKWIIRNTSSNSEYEWDVRCMNMLVAHNDISILKWARKYKCPWGETACAAAAVWGNLSILKWLRKKGCPWDHTTLEQAVSCGHLDIMEWAFNNGCPCTSEIILAYRLAGGQCVYILDQYNK